MTSNHRELLEERFAFEYLYPFPLADLYRRFRVSRSEVDRLGYVLAAGEASLKFLTALALARLHKGDSAFGALRLKSRVDHPGFGAWRSLLESLLSIIPSSPIPELEASLSLCRNESGGLSFLDSARILVERRNEFVHGGIIGNDRAAQLLDEVIPHFQRCYECLAFLRRFHFVYCEEVRKIRGLAGFETIVRRCTGSNPVFAFETLRLEQPLEPGVPLLLAPDLQYAVNLYPLVAMFPDEKAGSPRCYFYYNSRQETFWHTYELHKDFFRPAEPDTLREWESRLQGEGSALTQLRFAEGVSPYWLLQRGVQEPSRELPANYRMLGKIGQGRFGDVYKVVHDVLLEERALKSLRPEVAADPRVRKRFELEAQALARLQGKSVAVDVYEFGEDKEGVPYLIEKLCKEGSLDEALRRWGPKPWLEVRGIALKCFRQLEIIHDAGILHRDIKPSNILVDGDTFLFCDFGAGRLVDSEQSMTMGEGIPGTLLFMAPEQYEGHYDARSDIYSLGACLVSLLAGEVASDPRRWLLDSYYGSDGFRRALLSVLELVPENRPPNCAAVVTRLTDVPEVETAHSEEAITVDALNPIPVSRKSKRAWKNPDGIIFREILPGEHMMGGTKYPDERPVHKVRITKAFFISTTLITNRLFLRFCRLTNYRGVHRNFLFHIRGRFGRNWEHPDCPVVFVSWDDVNEFLLWQSERDGLNYHLPSEAQWEFVCRAGSRTVYWWGNEYQKGMANVDKVHDHPTPVGAYPPNPWGIFDMLGNVWEWCEDVKDVVPREESLFYRKCAMEPGGVSDDPVNSGSDALMSRRVQPSLRAIRGGSFVSEGRNFRPANRRGQHQEDCLRSIGFRVVVEGVQESCCGQAD